MITINNTMPGVIKNIEVKGNTYQDPNNLSKIVSAGIPNGDGTYKMSILSVGENLFNKDTVIADCYPDHTNGNLVSSNLYYTSDYIKIDASKTYVRNTVYADQKRYAFYDKDKKFTNGDIYGNLVPNANSCYVRVSLLKADLDKFKLQEGTVATPYTPYEETRCDIKLPCQLEKVGEVADKLHFDKDENALCIAKRNIDFNLLDYIKTANDIKTYADAGTDYLGFYVYIGNIQCEVDNMPRVINGDFGQSTKGTDVSAPTSKRCFASYESLNNRTYISFSLPKSCVPNNHTNDVWEYLKANNPIFTVAMHEPQKIILPQSEQIKLNSFANKTHIYTISGDVDTTVKATVSKSLASTVQANTEEINKINNTIADIQGLKESQDFAYETDKGYLVCKDTQTGVVKDLKIYGKSLVNAWNVSEWMKVNTQIVATDKTGTSVMQIPQKDNIFNAGDIVTVVADISVDNPTYCYWQVNYVSTTGEEKSLKNITFQSNIKSFVTQLPSDYSYMRCIFVGVQAGNTRTFKNNGCMCIKGDLSGRIPPYFEGIGSVGNGNEIEVLSRKEDGNLFNVNDFKRYVLGLGSGYSSYLVRDSRNCWYPTNYGVFHSKFMWDIRLDENVSYVIKFDYYFESSNQNKGLYFRVAYADGSFEYPVWGEQNKWSTAKITTNPNKAIAYIHMTYGESTNKTWIDLDSIVIAKAKNYNDKLENKQDKKTILFKDADNSWKSVTELNEWDVLDTTVNKLIIGTEKVSFSTNSNWRDNQSPSTTHKTYWIKYEGYKLNNVICDKLPTYNVATFDKKCIFTVNNEYLYFTIPISECSDISKLGEWFVANPMNILMPTPNKKEYEINPIYPESYSNETMILFGGGVIAPHASWKIASHAANIIKNQGQRLTRLENDFYKYTVVQNRIMLDSRYAADSATFKVDTSIYNSNNATASSLSASICAEKEIRQDVKYDFDLYKLIKRNILVGKDNYDRVWMKECITFYWMDFKISDEMYSELNEVIESQYNPPIDMTPIEDIVEEIPQI